jgi:alpha-galactosidase
MPKIVFIGAGSLQFTRALVRDLFTFPLLKGSTIALCDINEKRLKYAVQAVEKLIKAGNYPATVVANTDRRKLLKGADAVLVTILAGDVEVWQHDILIPKKYGVDTNVGDTRGPSGIFRALRTIPVMLGICRDMERLCPNAIMLNYTNPMAMLCNAMQRTSPIAISGLCHSVQGTAGMLARWCGYKPEDVDYLCAGVNHLSWYLKFEYKGRDLYPKLRKVVSTKKKIYNHEVVRNEMFLALDYYVTESSGHNSEYNWWFRKRPDLIRKYCTKGTGWNPGHYAFILKHYKMQRTKWEGWFLNWLNKPETELKRGGEYASYIINARMGGELFKFNGNVPNDGIITNLPRGCCVEVPVLASRKGFEPIFVGDLPPAVAPLTYVTATIEKTVVTGSLEGDADLVYRAICNDPLSAAVLSLAEIRKMTAEMFRKNKKWLPQFKNVKL